MNADEEEEFDVIMTKLRHLQESRHRRMCRWLEDTQSGSGDRPTSAAAPRRDTTSTTSLLLQTLQHELVSLLSRDDAIFRQLLVLRTSISQLKTEHQLTYAFNAEETEDEEEEEDLEVSYLSSSSGSSLVDKRSSSLSNNEDPTDDCDSFFFSSYSPCNNNNNNNTNSEDSAISLDFSTSSSAPSPTPTLPLPSSNFHRHNVTYPPTRVNRNRTSSIPQGVNALGVDQTTLPPSSSSCSSSSSSSSGGSSGKQRDNTNVLVQRLVRSKSITFLPRGVLFRREESCDSGFQDSKSPNAGEIFV